MLNLLNIAPIATITIMTGNQGIFRVNNPISSSSHARASINTIAQNVGNFAILTKDRLGLNIFLNPEARFMFI